MQHGTTPQLFLSTIKQKPNKNIIISRHINHFPQNSSFILWKENLNVYYPMNLSFYNHNFDRTCQSAEYTYFVRLILDVLDDNYVLIYRKTMSANLNRTCEVLID